MENSGSGTADFDGGKVIQTSPSRRQGYVLLAIGLALIAVGFIRGGNLLLVSGGIGLLAGAASVLSRYKPWARKKKP